jgi:hypothetical protein
VVIGREIDIFGVPTPDPAACRPLFIPGLSISNGNLNVQFSGMPGENYCMEYSEDLLSSNSWQVVAGIVPLATSPMAVSVPMTNGAGFYRMRWLP